MELPAGVGQRAELLETAFLLWGDEDEAETRVTAALARLGSTDDRDAAVRALLRTRSGSGVRATRTDPWWVSPEVTASAARTAAALAGLALLDRAALVLVELDGLDPAELPTRVGIDEPGARVARARAAVSRGAAAALTELVSVRHPPRWDDVQAAAEVRRLRRRRRTRPAIAAAGVAIAVAVALLVPRGGDDPVATEQSIRGSLADDDAALAAATDLAWPSAAGPTDPRVVVATDVLDTRWVLLAGSTRSGSRIAWFAGPAGTPVEDLAPVLEREVEPGAPVALATGAGLLVVADPGADVALSWAPDPADPAGTRTFTALPGADGVAAAALDLPARTGSAAVVRVGGEDLRPDVVDDRVPELLPRLERPASGTTTLELATAAAASAVALSAGLAVPDLTVTPVWSGQFDTGPAGQVDAVVARVGLPDGTTVVSTALAQGREDQSFLLAGCGTQVPRTTTAAARCTTADPSTGRVSSTVLVVGLTAPAELLTRDGAAVSALVPDGTGALAVRDDDGTGTVVRLSDSTELAVAESP